MLLYLYKKLYIFVKYFFKFRVNFTATKRKGYNDSVSNQIYQLKFAYKVKIIILP